MIKTLIVEDNRKSAQLLASYIENLFSDLVLVGTASNVSSAVALIHKEKPKLVFLDINLQEEIGFDVLKQTNTDDFEVIVTTAYSEYSLQAIKASAVDYILKPYDTEELKNAVRKAKNRLELKKPQSETSSTQELLTDRIFIPTLDGLIFVMIDEIICIKADTNYSEFYTTEGKPIVSSKGLSTYEEMLKSKLFVRVHKSLLVNLKHIVKYHRGRGAYLTMSNGMVVKVGESRKVELLKHLQL
ncbi:MAG: LytTR family DNA-binding domain-containing protein [Bacteroidales bacterium]